MTTVPDVFIQYIEDESVSSSKRSEDVAELVFKMMMLSRKLGRPAKEIEEELEDVA